MRGVPAGPGEGAFSITARCAHTGMRGIGIATYALAVGSRCCRVRAGVGALAIQAVTNPRLSPLGLGLRPFIE